MNQNWWNKISKVPFAKSEREQMKYSILRSVVACLGTLFLFALLILNIFGNQTAAMTTGLRVIWPISTLTYLSMWVVLGTRFFRTSVYIWTGAFCLLAFILVSIVKSEASIYRVQVFLTISLLIQSGYLSRRSLYLTAFTMYVTSLAAMYSTGFVSFGLAFPNLVAWLFALASLELTARIREAEAKMIEQERARALHSSRLSTLGETTAFLVHEVSSPLTILNGHLELIRKNHDPEYHVERMQNAMDRALDFIESVKKMVRASEPNQFEVVQLSEILKMVSDLIEPSLRRKNLQLEFDYLDDVELKCRPAEIAQVLINLINNSADAIGPNDPRWIRVSCKPANPCLDIEVSDNGKGIDPGVGKKVMEPFFTTKPTGSGIGLSIAQQVATHHDGKVDIISFGQPTVVQFRVALQPRFAGSSLKEDKSDNSAELAGSSL